MTDQELLTVARLLHQHTANSPAHRNAGCIIHGLMATLTTTVGMAVAGAPGALLGLAVPTWLSVTRTWRMQRLRRQSEVALAQKPNLRKQVEKLNSQEGELHFEVRTPRAVSLYHVQLREDVVIAGATYPEWLLREEFAIEPPGRGGATRVRLGATWHQAFINEADYRRYELWRKAHD